MRGLNPDQLRALIEVVQQGSFSAAARKLNLTQPAISLQVRELERRFGVRLIERLGKTAFATAPGDKLFEAAQRILHECEKAEVAMRRFRDGWIGRVVIGTTNTGLMYELPPILRRLISDYPGLDLHVTNLPTRESVEGIIQNRIDIALVTLPVDGQLVKITPLREELMVAILPKEATDVPDEISPDYVARHPLLMEHTRGAVHDLVWSWLSREKASPRVSMHLGTIEAMKAAVSANLGMAIVPSVAAPERRADFLVRPLRPALTFTKALIEHHAKPNEPALQIVRAALLGLREERRFIDT